MYIDLRAQLVPIVAAFVALGIGILIGSMLSADGNLLVEQQLLIENLEQQFSSLRNTNLEYRARVGELERQLREHDQFIETEVLPEFVGPTVAGLQVAVLDLGMDGLAEEVATRLTDWGADTLVLSASDPAGLVGLEAPSTDGQSAQPTLEGTHGIVQALRQLLTGDPEIGDEVQKAGFVLTGAIGARPDAILILVDPGLNRLFGTLLTPLVAGLRSDKMNIVAAERANEKASLMDMWRTLSVSTVDNVDSGVGFLSLVLVLEGRRGHYGTGDSSERLIPTLADQVLNGDTGK